MSQRRAMGNRVLTGRLAKGLSLHRAARRLGVSPRALRGWEKGRDDIPYEVRLAMVKLYQMVPEQLVPERPSAGVRDAGTGTIRIGSVTFAAHEADDDSLRAFLSAVRSQRGLAANAKLAVRASDADVLAEILGGSAEHIVRNLQRLLGVDEAEAVDLGRWMFRRTALAGALAVGLVTGVAGIGPLSSNLSPAAAAETSTTGHAAAPGPEATGDPNWAVIGDAAVLERDRLPGNG